MTVRGVASVLMVLLVLAVVLLAAREPAPIPDPPRQFFVLGDGTDFELPVGSDRLRLLVTRPGTGEPGPEPVPLDLELTFSDAAGATLANVPVRLESRPAVVPGQRDPWRPTTRTLGDRGWMLEPRVVRLDLPPGAVTVRVAGDPDTLVRPFARGADAITLGRALAALSREDRTRIMRATGAPDPGLLTQGERDAVMALSWKRLGPSDPDGATARPVSTEPLTGALGSAVFGTVLDPGAAAAWTLRGDARVRLGGTPGVHDLKLGVVGEGSPTVRAHIEAGGGGWALTPQLREATVFAEGLVTLVVSNPTAEPVRLWARVAPDTEIFGEPLVVPLDPVQPGNPGLLVQPELRLLPVWTATARRFAVRAPVLKIEAWQALEGWHDGGPRAVQLRSIAADGTVLWSAPWTVTGTLSPLDGVGSRATRDPVSGSTATLVAPGPDAAWLEVDAGPDVLVRAHVSGPSRGEVTPLADPSVRLRYAAGAASSWVAWPPVDPARDAHTVTAAVRIEVRGDDEDGRRYRAVDLPGGSEVWALQDRAGSTAPSVCRVPAGGQRRVADPAAPDVLSAWLWAPPGPLDDDWQITLGGLPWRGGPFEQRVARVRGAPVVWPIEVGLQAPPGAVLWVQGTDRMGCADRWRVVGHRRLEAGRSLRVWVPPGAAGRLLAVSALAGGPTVVELRFEGERPSLDATRPEVVLDLHRQGRDAVALRRPGLEREVVGAPAIRLGSDLAGGGTMVLTSRSDETVYVRAVVEATGPGAVADPTLVLRPEEVVP